jgi:hypothetical protein
MSGDVVEKLLYETLSDSENNLFDSDDNCSVIEDTGFNCYRRKWE